MQTLNQRHDISLRVLNLNLASTLPDMVHVQPQAVYRLMFGA